MPNTTYSVPEKLEILIATEPNITHEKAHQRCRGGIGRSYQVPQPFGHLSVFENLVTAACFGGGQSERDAWDTAYQVLKTTGLLAQANTTAGSLTLLNRKRLELARAGD